MVGCVLPWSLGLAAVAVIGYAATLLLVAPFSSLYAIANFIMVVPYQFSELQDTIKTLIYSFLPFGEPVRITGHELEDTSAPPQHAPAPTTPRLMEMSGAAWTLLIALPAYAMGVYNNQGPVDNR